MPHLRKRRPLVHRLAEPRPGCPRVAIALRDVHPPVRDYRRDQVGPRHLVRVAWVVAAHRQARPLQVLDQRYACTLVFDQHHVGLLPRSELVWVAVHVLVRLRHLDAQVGVLDALRPSVDDHATRRPILRLEHAKHHACRRVVDRLLRRGRVVRLDHHRELRQAPLGRPQLEPLTLDQAVVARVQEHSVDLLVAKLGALVLENLRLERGREVVEVVVGRRTHVADVVPVPLDQVKDQRLGPWRRRAHQARVLAQAHAELNLRPRLVEPLPCRKLVEPTAVELRPPEALGLGRRYALDDAVVDQDDFRGRDHVVLDQLLGHHVQDA